MRFNVAAWVEGNPINAIDPSGLTSIPTVCSLGAGACAVATLSPFEGPVGEAVICSATAACISRTLGISLAAALVVLAVELGLPDATIDALQDILGLNSNTTNPSPTQSVGGVSPSGNASVPEDLLELCLAINNGICDPNSILVPEDGMGATLPNGWIYSPGPSIVEYRLQGFPSRVGTLALHLAKLLARDVAGYGPSGPNPYGDPDRGWCTTIKNKITEIRNARYSEAQLLRDLNNSGFGGDRWAEIIEAIAEVVARGLCDDHWPDDFDGGGPLATA